MLSSVEVERVRLTLGRSGGAVGVGGGFLALEEGRHREKARAASQKAISQGIGLRSARVVAGWEPL